MEVGNAWGGGGGGSATNTPQGGDHRGEGEAVGSHAERPHAAEQSQGCGRIAVGGVGGEERVEGDEVRAGDVGEELAGGASLGATGVGGEEGVVGEDVWLGNFLEHSARERRLPAAGVEEDQVVAQVGGRGEPRLEEEAMERASDGDVSAAVDAALQEEPQPLEPLQLRRDLVHRRGSSSVKTMILGYAPQCILLIGSALSIGSAIEQFIGPAIIRK